MAFPIWLFTLLCLRSTLISKHITWILLLLLIFLKIKLSIIDIAFFYYLSKYLMFIVQEFLSTNSKISSPEMSLWNTFSLIRIISRIGIRRAIFNKMASTTASSTNITSWQLLLCLWKSITQTTEILWIRHSCIRSCSLCSATSTRITTLVILIINLILMLNMLPCLFFVLIQNSQKAVRSLLLLL